MKPTTEEETTPVDPLGRRSLPLKVSNLRRGLGQKAKQEPKFRFYALYDRIYRPDVLQAAYQQIRKLGSAAGVDGVRFEDIEETLSGVSTFMTELHEDLKAKRYRPSAVKRVHIPKPDGGTRPLGIPTVRDRVVQMAVLLVIEPIFEADFRESSFGFRPGKNAHQALDAIRAELAKGKRDVYDADLQGYFDTIPHAKLMACLEHRIADQKVLKLFRLWLQAPIDEQDEKGHRTTRKPKSGTPQGGVISPLLANIYLHWFEVLFYSSEGPARWANASLVRYADDFVVLAKYQGSRLRDWIELTLEDRFDLTINRKKTRVVHMARGEGLDFLGFTMRYERSIYGTGNYLHVGPSLKSQSRFREKLRQLASTRHCFVPSPTLVKQVNRVVQGWGRYFSYGHPRRAFGSLNKFVQDRVGLHLKRRSQRGCRPGDGVTMYSHLYDNLGLQKLEKPH